MSQYTPKLAIAGTAGAGLFLAVILLTGNVSSVLPVVSGDDAGLVQDNPLPHQLSSMHIENTKISQKIVANSDIDFTVAEDTNKDLAIIIKAVNKGSNRAELKADQWNIQFKNAMSGKGNQPKDITKDVRLSFIQPGMAAEFARIDLSDHEHEFMDFPGTYQVVIWGDQYVDTSDAPSSGATEPDTTIELTGETVSAIPVEIQAGSKVLENRYKIVADVDVGYNIDAIKANPNKLLKAEKMRLAFEGENKDYLVSPSKKSEARLYLINDKETPISSIVRVDSITIFKADDPSVAVGFEGVFDYIPGFCSTIEPNEIVPRGKVILDTTQGPLKELMNKLAGEDPKKGTALLEGLYIVKAEAGSVDCTTEDGRVVEGSGHELVAAFEVTQ
ncbi:MAG TPA: hypothetical protein VNI77_04050 [Nitrososphaera sp.]|nr:hypothetical protein [Nitrososphaera sp.]